MNTRLLAISVAFAAAGSASWAQTTVITTTPAPAAPTAPVAAPAPVVVPAPQPIPAVVPAPQPVPPVAVVPAPAPAPVTVAAPAPVVVPAPAVVVAAPAPVAVVLCDLCGTVQEIKTEERKGKGGAVGIIGGALAGGLLGNQIGKGDGNKVATVGGAVGGAVAGNEIQKQVTAKKVWLSTVKMKDGSVKTVEQEVQPAWATGDVVKIDGNNVSKI
jgi:outer membrane lipoprotein SlyB